MRRDGRVIRELIVMQRTDPRYWPTYRAEGPFFDWGNPVEHFEMDRVAEIDATIELTEMFGTFEGVNNEEE